MNEINRPLSSKALSSTRRPDRSINPFQIFFGVATVMVAAMALWVALVDDPGSQGPVAIAVIQRIETSPPKADRIDRTGKGDGGGESAIEKPVAEPVPEPPVALQRPDIFFDPGLIQMTENGPLPILGPSGERPMDVYAQPSQVPPPNVSGAPPQVALVVLNLGLSSLESERAVDQLPSPTTLAFSPYGVNLRKSVERARRSRHEVLLQIPLEPVDFPQHDPGPHTLRVGSAPTDVKERLDWLLARFPGYAGVTHWRGARWVESSEDTRRLLARLREHGLYFFDSAPNDGSRVPEEAVNEQLPFIQADVVVDRSPTPQAMKEKLAALIETARIRGHAIGVFERARPISVEMIRKWTEELHDSGVSLVPLSALLSRPTATTRHPGIERAGEGADVRH